MGTPLQNFFQEERKYHPFIPASPHGNDRFKPHWSRHLTAYSKCMKADHESRVECQSPPPPVHAVDIISQINALAAQPVSFSTIALKTYPQWQLIQNLLSKPWLWGETPRKQTNVVRSKLIKLIWRKKDGTDSIPVSPYLSTLHSDRDTLHKTC